MIHFLQQNRTGTTDKLPSVLMLWRLMQWHGIKLYNAKIHVADMLVKSTQSANVLITVNHNNTKTKK